MSSYEKFKEEIITFGLQTRASFASQKDMLMQFFEGEVSEDDILKSFNKELPLRDKILKDILIALRDGYNNKHNNEYAYNNGGETFAGDTNKRLGSEHLRPSTRGGVLDDTRFSLPDMPFFEDNGDIVSFDENITPEERLNTLLAETEDVAREDQIFLREGAEMAMAKKRNQLMRPCPRIIRIILLPSHRLMVQRY